MYNKQNRYRTKSKPLLVFLALIIEKDNNETQYFSENKFFKNYKT